jgi:hypothetical protein
LSNGDERLALDLYIGLGFSIILYGIEMSVRAALLIAPLILGGLAGCEAPRAQYASLAEAPAHDRLLAPQEVVPGRLAYVDAPDAFAPVLASRVAYPTQAQANYAYQRSWASNEQSDDDPLALNGSDPKGSDRGPVRVRLFACRSGALDDITARIVPTRGPVVHCATDFVDAQDRRLFRETVNFFYERGAWRMAQTAPPKARAPWIAPEASPKDYFSWSPWGRRTTPY